ncbi:MAG TPA: hypothetical protein VJU61_14965, partial [Polyangiaceae bacterium]|nr:hypothetical protein [Polyangiaceae bacterium]
MRFSACISPGSVVLFWIASGLSGGCSAPPSDSDLPTAGSGGLAGSAGASGLAGSAGNGGSAGSSGSGGSAGAGGSAGSAGAG